MADLEPGVILSPSTVAAMERLSTSPRTAMTDQYKATTYEQWERQERRAMLHALDDQDAPCLLELRDRVAALEAAQQLRTFTAEEVASVVVPTGKESLTDPARTLVERVAWLIAKRFSESRPGTDCTPFGRDVIREVAAWLRENPGPNSAWPAVARDLMDEARR
jgi:hypothetical protein